ncbi:UNVERIFIED_CONTAM: hypothetical protein FKN15_051401 [Acipenser sinensis]
MWIVQIFTGRIFDRLFKSAYRAYLWLQTGANDLQTKADRLVQQCICSSLTRMFPKITIIGEEKDNKHEEKAPVLTACTGQREYPNPYCFHNIMYWAEGISKPILLPELQSSSDNSMYWAEGISKPILLSQLQSSSANIMYWAEGISKPILLSQLQSSSANIMYWAEGISKPILLPELQSSSANIMYWAEGISKPILLPELQRVCASWLVVWVDPLDGTKEYTEGLLDHVTVLIGIAYDGKAIAGVINQPFHNYELGPSASLGRTLWGILGVGSFGFELREVADGRRIVTTTRSHSNQLVTECVNAMEPHQVIRVGGAGNKIIQLIEGKASAYVFASPGCKKWDTCAPEAILHAVGGKLTDMHGKPYRYHKDVKHMNSAGVLATLKDFEFYASRVPEAVKQALKSD